MLRDYKHEYQLRKEKTRQFNAKIERDKADEFIKTLNKRDITFSNWLNNKIDNELKDPNE